MKKLRLCVIGGGNMATAIVAGAVQRGVLTGAEIAVAEPNEERWDRFLELGCRVVAKASGLPDCDHLLLAVKPQVFPEIASDIRDQPAATVMSIMAGVRRDTIAKTLDAMAVVRLMPNLPCSIGVGATAIAAGSEPHDVLAREIFEAIGTVMTVDESVMDAVTAVSGSGPAYLFLLAEGMVAGAIKCGVDRETAELLVQQTLLGAATMLSTGHVSAENLRRAVTSPGGTTEAALAVLADGQMLHAVTDAVIAARDRARSLSV
jgi:pyrroline-5-carboxylate reductase